VRVRGRLRNAPPVIFSVKHILWTRTMGMILFILILILIIILCCSAEAVVSPSPGGPLAHYSEFSAGLLSEL